MSQQSQHDLIKKLKPARIIIPVLIGLAVVVWLILKEIKTDVFSQLSFTWRSVFWLFAAWCCMLFRDLGYMIRIRILSDKVLSWWSFLQP